MVGEIAFRRLLSVGILCYAASSVAQMADPAADRLPLQFGNIGIEQRLNQPVPLQTVFRDESGQAVRLGNYFHSGRPVVLSLVYYNCQMLCSQVLSELAATLRRLKFNAGQQFEIVTVSFDPHETAADAVAAKKKYLAMYGRAGAERGWHFLTGEQPSILELANAVGFHYRWDERSKQFAHATGIMLLTPEGRVAQYYYGAKYFASDLRLGLIQASQNQIGTLADQIVLYCYHYDPRTGRYGAIVSRVIQVSGAFTLLIFGGILIFLFRTDTNSRIDADQFSAEHTPVTQSCTSHRHNLNGRHKA
jgi:protein SCO1/2